jgi:hypothetical protein
MALTRPRLGQLNTSVVAQADPITVLNQGATQANIDVGFLFNRANGLVSNVALYWSESAQSIVTAYTDNTGATNSNISVTSYANLTVGNVLLVTGSILNVQGNIASNTTGILYGNVNSSGNISTSGNVYASSFFYANGTPFTSSSYGNVQMLANLAAGSNPVTFGSNIVANSGTASTSTTTGALTVSGGVGIAGNLFAGNASLGSNMGNYVQIQGAVAGSAVPWPVLSTQGTDSTVHMWYQTKGLGAVRFQSQAGAYTQLRIDGTVAAQNALNIFGGASGVGPTLGVIGNDANSDLNLAANGTGNVTTSSPIRITNANVSTSATTGALVVSGGAGIAGNVYVGGNLTVQSTQGNIQFVVGNTTSATSYVRVTGGGSDGPTISAAGAASQISLILQAQGGAPQANVYVKSDLTIGAQQALNLGIYGTTSSSPLAIWNTSVTKPSIVLNSSGPGYGLMGTTGPNSWALGYNTDFSQPATSSVLLWNANGTVIIPQTVTSNSTSTGALIVSGGAGIAGNLNVGGNLSVLGNITTLNYETVLYTETANNIVVTGNLAVAGNIASNVTAYGNVYAVGTNSKHGYTWANSVSSAYTVFNSSTNSVDLIFG